MSSVGIIVQARLASTRLPGKVLMDINGKPLLQYIIEAAKVASKRIATECWPDRSRVILVTPDKSLGEEEFVRNSRIEVRYPTWEGRDVLREFHSAAKYYILDTVVRLTADCPMITADKIMHGIKSYKEFPPHCEDKYFYQGPDGMDVEIISFELLNKAYELAVGEDREHVGTWLKKQIGMNAIFYDPMHSCDCDYRSVNTQDDLEWVRERMKIHERT